MAALAHRFHQEIVRSRVMVQASAASFWLFLSLVPIAAVAGMVAAKIESSQPRLLTPMLASLPSGARDLLHTEVARVAAWDGGAVAPLSVAGFVWLASSGVHAVLDAFDVITEQPRSWVRKRALAVAICLALSLVVGGLGVVIGLASRVVSFGVPGAVRWSMAFALEVALIAGFFAAGAPRRKRAAIRVLPGALAAATAHVAAGYGYAQWVRHIGDGGAYLAGLATIAVTMTASWVFVLSLLLGLSLGKVLSVPPGEVAPRPALAKLRMRLKWGWRHFLAQLDPKPRRRRRGRRRRKSSAEARRADPADRR